MIKRTILGWVIGGSLVLSIASVMMDYQPKECRDWHPPLIYPEKCR